MKRKYISLTKVDVTPLPMISRAFLGFPHQPKCIWDIGCGAGAFLIEAKLRYQDVKLIGIEKNLDYEAVQQENLKLHGIDKDAIDFQFRDAVYDSIDDLEQPDAIFLSCAGRAEEDLIPVLWEELKPGGVIVANVRQYGGNPNIPKWVARIQAAQAAYGGKLEDYTNWFDISNDQKSSFAVEHVLHWEGRKPAE